MKDKPAGKAERILPPEPVAKESAGARLISGSRPEPAFGHILVAIDFSDSSLNALEYAFALAQKFHSQLTLLHVVEAGVYSPGALLGAHNLDEAGQNLLAEGRERLSKLKQRIMAQGLHAEALARIGRTQSDISDTAKAIGANLIIMGTHGHGGPGHSVLGTTAERVLRQAVCPVLAVPQN